MAYTKHLAEGALFVPSPRALKPGAELRINFVVPGRETLGCHAKVVDRKPDGAAQGFFATLTPSASL